MRKQLISGLVMAFAFGAAAHAAPLVTNGDFEAVTGVSAGTSFEYDPSQPSADHGVVTGWQVVNPAGQNSYNILFNASTATSVQPLNRYSGTTDNQDLWFLPSNNSTFGIGNNFMALDGDTTSPNNVQGEIQQTINGLVKGQVYTLTFDFAASQLKDRNGATTEQLQVSLGGETHSTDILSDASDSTTPWKLETMHFTATDTSEVLSFLSWGTPTGDPPMALLDNVSLVNSVPEPATWGLMIVGLAGIGASLRMRRRQAATLA